MAYAAFKQQPSGKLDRTGICRDHGELMLLGTRAQMLGENLNALEVIYIYILGALISRMCAASSRNAKIAIDPSLPICFCSARAK